mgnify:FL=1
MLGDLKNGWKRSVVKRRSSGKKVERLWTGNENLKKIKYESFLYREALLAVSNVLENKTGCRFLTVDAYAAAVPFYEKNGFIPLNNEDVDSATRLLYFDLNDIVL